MCKATQLGYKWTNTYLRFESIKQWVIVGNNDVIFAANAKLVILSFRLQVIKYSAFAVMGHRNVLQYWPASLGFYQSKQKHSVNEYIGHTRSQKRTSCNEPVEILQQTCCQQADIKMRSNACDSLLKTSLLQLSTDLMQGDCQNLTSTGLLQIVSTSCCLRPRLHGTGFALSRRRVWPVRDHIYSRHFFYD